LGKKVRSNIFLKRFINIFKNFHENIEQHFLKIFQHFLTKISTFFLPFFHLWACASWWQRAGARRPAGAWITVAYDPPRPWRAAAGHEAVGAGPTRSRGVAAAVADGWEAEREREGELGLACGIRGCGCPDLSWVHSLSIGLLKNKIGPLMICDRMQSGILYCLPIFFIFFLYFFHFWKNILPFHI
jgi:hypothetical protein